jgi:hypothetical protein
MAGGANEIAQNRHVGSVSPYTASIYGEAEPLGDFEVNPGVVELREAKAHCREHTMGSARINRARRPVLVPPAVDYREELVPIVFVPHGLFPLPRDSRQL